MPGSRRVCPSCCEKQRMNTYTPFNCQPAESNPSIASPADEQGLFGPPVPASGEKPTNRVHQACWRKRARGRLVVYLPGNRRTPELAQP